jgi:FKBP-type peptidyl-prolyl cis-trans isomerase SlyD
VICEAGNVWVLGENQPPTYRRRRETILTKKNDRRGIQMIENGSLVHFEYTLSDENGKILQSNKGKDPITYTHGLYEVIPGLEEGLSGMDINEEKSFCIQPEEGYGPVDSNAFKEVPKTEIPATALKVGTALSAQGPEGKNHVVHVCEVKQETVILDFNHPLAGKTVNFDVKVLNIEPKKS